MSYLKAKTASGVGLTAPLKTRADYYRAINFLQKEMEIEFSEQKSAVKKPVQKKSESPELKKFLEGVTT